MSPGLEKTILPDHQGLTRSGEGSEKKIQDSPGLGRDVADGRQAPHRITPGGAKAWLYVLAAFLIFNSAWGLTQVFGAFQEIYLDALLPGVSSSSISWVGSLQCFLVIVLGAFTGPLFDAGYLHALLLVGCFLIIFGMAMLSLATQYWHVFLAQAICAGLGGGLVFVPCLALVSTAFPDSTRPWAIGLTNGGGSIGGIMFTFMLRRLYPVIGFAWTVRCIALVCLVQIVASLAILLTHKHQPKQKRRALLDIHAFREPNFMIFSLGLFFAYIAFYIPPFYIPTFAIRALGQGRDFAFNCLVFVSVGSFFGRTVPMLAAAKFGSVQLHMAASVGAVAVLFAWIAVRNTPSFVVFSLAYGLVSGVLVAAPSAAISHPVLSPSMDVIGTRMGMTWMFGGFGVLIGAPIAGSLADVHQGKFLPAQGFAGGMMAACSLCLVVPLVAVVKHKQSRAQ